MRIVFSWMLLWFALGIAMASIYGIAVKQEHFSAWVVGGTPMSLSTAVAIISICLALMLRFYKPKRCENGH
jgi:hypothetical protein